MHTLSPSRPRNRRSSGFSLVELIIVVVIIGLLAAIAIPRFSRGAANTNETAFAGDMAVLRNALELYAVEHNGLYPAAESFEAQMTKFTDESGATSDSKIGGFEFGPYLVAVPAVKVGASKGQNGVAASPVPPEASAAVGVGWVYNQNTGQIWPNDASKF